MSEGREIEWGGLTAYYEPHELADFEERGKKAAALPKGSPERNALVQEARVIHQLKANLGARQLTVKEEEYFGTVETPVPVEVAEEPLEPVYIPPPDSPFQLPASVQASLASPDANRLGKFQNPDSGAAVTQRQAAILAFPGTGTQRRRVLDHIARTGGATDEEMQQALDMNPSTQRPRRVELVDDGWVEDSGRTRKTPSGRDAVVWVLTEQGRGEWKEVM